MTTSGTSDLAAALVRTTRSGRPAWIVRTERSSMVLSIAADGVLVLDHWGADGGDVGDDHGGHATAARPGHMQQFDALPLAYPTYGDPQFKETCLAAVFDDGTRHVRLRFVADRLGRTEDGTRASSSSSRTPPAG